MVNRFKGLDLVDGVLKELWMEVCNIVQETVTKTIPKKCKKANCLSEEMAGKRREVICKGERGGYTQLIAELQRIARREKKGFLNEQCKEIEENNRTGKTSHLFKKIGNLKGTFRARRGMIKDRNVKDLTEAEQIKKRWQEYTELYKKGLNDPP